MVSKQQADSLFNEAIEKIKANKKGNWLDNIVVLSKAQKIIGSL